MGYFGELLKELKDKESEIELSIEDIKLGTDHLKVGLHGKVRLRLIHLHNSKSK